MKIVDVCGFYSERGGGVRSYVHQKFAAAARHGHDLTVIAPGVQSAVESRSGGRIVWVASPPMPFDANYRLFWGSRDVIGVLNAKRPDVVEGSSTWRGGWIAAGWPGACVKSLVFHQDFVAAYAHTLLDAHLSRAAIDGLFAAYWRHLARLSGHFDVTVAGGAWLADRLATFGLRNPIAVPLGVESGRFSPARRDEALRRDLLARCGVGPDGVLLLAAGRFHPEKRHGVIIEGFARARERRPGMGLVLAGDGFRRKSVEAAAGRTGNVHLTGAISDRDTMARLYASADLLVHGSGAETYGLVVAEAISSGLRVVVPDSGGASDFAARAPGGVYATGNGAACADAILRALASPARCAASLNEQENSLVGSAETHFADLFSLYQTLIDAKRAASRGGPWVGLRSARERVAA